MSYTSEVNSYVAAAAAGEMSAEAAKQEIDAAKAVFLPRMVRDLVPHGERLTADAQLFMTGIPLDKIELEYLADLYGIYNVNPTMLRLVFGYAAAHNIELDREYYTAQQTAEAAETIATAAKAAIDAGESAFDIPPALADN